MTRARRRLVGLAENLDLLAPLAPAAADAPEVGLEGHRGRMRTKLLAAGPAALGDHEMLEMVLFLALPRRDTKQIGRELLARFGSLAAVVAAPVPELLGIDGIGEAGAAALKTIQAAALRLTHAEVENVSLLDNWEKLIGYLTAAMALETVEHVRVLYLDTRNRLLADERQGQGTVNHTPVYPREVVKRALELHASALILAHNHPSGDPTPSREDIAMTNEIKRAAELMRIAVHDHVIIAGARWLSFRREGLL
jgi:DNA repair protein RadC